MDDMPCEVCGPERECTCPPCGCIHCAPPTVVSKGKIIDFEATKNATAKKRLLWELEVFGQ